MQTGPATQKLIEDWGEQWCTEALQYFELIYDFTRKNSRVQTILDELLKIQNGLHNLRKRGYLNDKNELAVYDSLLQNLGVYKDESLAMVLVLRAYSRLQCGAIDDYALDILICFLTMGPGLRPLREPNDSAWTAWANTLGTMVEPYLYQNLYVLYKAQTSEFDYPNPADYKPPHKISWAVLSRFMTEQKIADKGFKVKADDLRKRYKRIVKWHTDDPEDYELTIYTISQFAWTKKTTYQTGEPISPDDRALVVKKWCGPPLIRSYLDQLALKNRNH